MKPILIVILSVIILIVTLVILLPVFLLPKITNQTEFDNIKSIYTVMASITTIVIGFSGVLIGYFYYKDKIKNDKEQNIQRRLLGNIKSLLEEVKNINENLSIIFDKNIKDQSDLRKKRYKINESLDSINLLLETNEEVFGFKDVEIKKIIKQYSLIEKSEILMRASLARIKKSDLQVIKEQYCHIYKSILPLLFKKL